MIGKLRFKEGTPEAEMQYALKGVSMPRLHHRIVKHLKRKGYPPNIAWPIAVEAVAKGCLFGISSLPGDKGKKVKMGAKARARYCKAYAEWKKNHKGTGFGKKIGRG